jgi:hypothetical protein
MVTAGLLGPKTRALRLLALDLKAGKQGKQGLPFVSLYDRVVLLELQGKDKAL